MRRSGTGIVRIACTPALGMSVMPSIIAKFQQSHPDVRTTLRTIGSYYVREGLVNGLYDVGLTTNRIQVEGSQLQAKTVDQVAAVCVMSRSHRLAKEPHIAARHFHDEILLTLDRDDDLSDEWRRVLLHAGVRPASVIETTYSATICQLAEAGAGIGIVNPYIASVFADRIRVVPIRPALAVKVFVAYPTHVAMSSLAADLMSRIGEHFGSKLRAPRQSRR
nr:LysR substrate-binding domain-containing protein [Variibacter gotjawalensis]